MKTRVIHPSHPSAPRLIECQYRGMTRVLTVGEAKALLREHVDAFPFDSYQTLSDAVQEATRGSILHTA